MRIRYGTYTNAYSGRSYVPTTPFDAVERVRSGKADGLTIDVIDRYGNVAVSYEVTPGRDITRWADEECYWLEEPAPEGVEDLPEWAMD